MFYDYKKIGIIEVLNQVRKCIINNFYETIPDSRIRVSLSINDDIFLKIMVMKLKKILKIFIT